MQDDVKKPRRWLFKLSLAIVLIVIIVLALALMVLLRGITLGPQTVAGMSVGHFSLRLERKLHASGSPPRPIPSTSFSTAALDGSLPLELGAPSANIGACIDARL